MTLLITQICSFRTCSRSGSADAQIQFEAVGSVLLEILIQRSQTQAAADGEGRQIGIHPNLGRGQMVRRQAMPKSGRARRLFALQDLRQCQQGAKHLQGIIIARPGGAVGFQDCGRAGQAQKALLRGVDRQKTAGSAGVAFCRLVCAAS